MNQLTGNNVAWLGLGVPAILGWIGYGLAVLLAPHLAFDPVPLMWAAYAVGTWYGLGICLAGGSLALFCILHGLST